MSGAAGPRPSFLAAQRWRLGLAWEDARRLAAGLRAVCRARRAAPPGVGVAQLEGPAVARVDGQTAIRVRVHNPTDAVAVVTVQVRGGARDGGPERFRATWPCTLAAGGAEERWLHTRFAGDAIVDAGPPAPEPLSAPGTRWWFVEAVVVGADGREGGGLEIRGRFAW